MDDYISRDEAMSLPVLPKEQRIQLDNVDEAFEEGWRQALENLAILPAADVVEVQHGEWINERWEGLSSFSAECSLCGKRTLAYFHYSYCPNCGVRMDGGQDNG